MSKIRQKSDYEAKGADIHSYPSQYDNKDYGVKRKAKTKNVVIKNTTTGQVYGYKTVEEGEFTFTDYLELAKLNEMASKWKVEFDDGTSEEVVADDRQSAKLKIKATDKHIKKITRVELGTLEEATSEKDTRYPEAVMSEISSLITKGAKDLEQKWKNTFELVHTAFHVANVKRPQYDQKGAWKQYEDMLAHAVRALRKARGANWSGRESGVGWHPDMDLTEDMCATPELDQILNESTDGRKRRIFVKVRNIGFDDEEKEHEVEADHINDVIHSMFHHARKNGRHIHIDPLGKGHVKLTVHVKGTTGKTRDEQIIHVKDWSL